MYVFAQIKKAILKLVGYYKGNGNVDGTLYTILDFNPAFLLIKRTNGVNELAACMTIKDGTAILIRLVIQNTLYC